jgi:hypothetical protein
MSCDVTSTRIDIVQGDTAVLKFTITKADCVTPEDLAGYSAIRFTIKRSKQDLDSAAVFQGTLADDNIAVLDPSSDGQLEVTMPPAASLLMRSGRPYYWDLQIEADPTNVYTPQFGTIFASTETTRTT